MATKLDAIIVGGGHNGLVCAAYLAKAGRKVLVLERRHIVGGSAVTEEIYPGFRYCSCSYVVSLMRPQIIRDLKLSRFGYEVMPLECSFTPQPDGRSLCRWPDPDLNRQEIKKLSPKDADIYPEFGRAMGQLARFTKAIIDENAPEPTSLHPKDLLQLLGFGKRFRELGDDLGDLQFKLLTMSAVDFLKEWFESDELIAPMSCSGIIGTFLGVKSPGTAYVLLHHYMGEIDGASRAWGFARGGNGGLSDAIAASAQHFGAEIRTSTPVQKIIVEKGEAKGVVLENGGELRAKTVISCCDPRLTFSGLVGTEHLPDEFVTAIKRYQFRGSSGKVNLALDRFPEFSCRPGDGPHVRGDVAIAPSTDYLERAYDDAKYGDFSRRPYLNIVFPSLLDRTMAPPGKHVLSAFVQYAPYEIKEGPEAWPTRREAFGDAVVDTIAEYCPTIKEDILHRQVLTPWDLEQEYGLTEGNIFHGELSLNQLLFQRPAAGWSRYKTPVHHLWLCGSGAHPGGGVMGAPGAMAAQEMLRKGAV
ncbi:MAG: NAD(P)/FAD-dependent oxidoreductase [Proteobacteria bacterium]|jgi:phytoene dehydrogenase-like protein|nr:NAD(P)/FAD-dependent oxidoreductase [Pseudomonadota bacterium]